ncbi:LPXTG cell wall anchor domain-containing protein, partial [Streptomyces sp. SID7982]|nr:LPXTG cell wall anchor domain-containing protein [Streptomyces sp. SID7982]
AYDFTITGPAGFSRTFTGTLDCATSGSVLEQVSEEAGGAGNDVGTQSAEQSLPATTGAASSGLEGDLAATGGSSATPMLAAVAIGLLVVGGGAVFALRRKKPHTDGE